MITSPLLVVRYAGGSCGRFISTIFQTSNTVACWNKELENAKSRSDFENYFLQYIKASFPYDHRKHLILEPDLPYFTDFYSGTFERGNDISYDEYCAILKDHNDAYFQKNLADGKKVNLILHKSKIPKFMQHASFVNIIIDTKQSLEFVQKLLWSKHFEILSDNSVLHLPFDPSRCNPKRSHLVKRFSSELPILTGTIDEIYKRYILDNPEFKIFSSTDKLYIDESNKTVVNTEFHLSDILNSSKFCHSILEICDKLSLEPPNKSLIKCSHEIWMERQL